MNELDTTEIELKQPVQFRKFGDAPTTRGLIFNNVMSAAQNIKPISNQRHTLQLTGVAYHGPEQYSKKDIKQAVVSGQSLTRKLRGTWQLLDNTTGEPIAEKTSTLANVPYYTDDGVFIQNGVAYSLAHQLRLSPGIFARQKANGELESHVNVAPGKGRSHRVFMDPESGVFKINIGQANMPLYPVLRAMGATDEQLRTSWGRDLASVNAGKNDSQVIRKLYERIARKRVQGADEATMSQSVADAFNNMELDGNVTRRTLGSASTRMDLPTLLATTSKLIALNKGEAEPDDRDHLAYQHVFGPEDLIAERLANSQQAMRQLLWKASTKSNLNAIGPGFFDKMINSAIVGSGLGAPIEQINPLEVFDQQSRVTRMGEGGISSLDSVPEDSRMVQPSQFGFIDYLRTPESSKAGVDMRLARNAVKGSDNRLYTQVIDNKTGQTVLKSPQDMADSVLGFPDDDTDDSPMIPALVNGRLRYVSRDKVDYHVPDMESAFSPLGNLIPLKSMVKGQRAVMAARMITQALPLTDGEAPLLQSGIPGQADRSFEDEYGAHAGAIFADSPATVAAVDDDSVTLKLQDGSTKTVELFNNLPSNRKTFMHQTAVVQPGDTVAPGQLLARSNYTDANGSAGIGKNLRVAYLAYKGLNFEDANVISETAAKKLSSEHAYQHELEWDPKHHRGLRAFASVFPSTYKREQLANFNDDGLIKPGTEVRFGDPLVLAVRERERTHGSIHRGRGPSFTDATITWNHHSPGVVTDSVNTERGAAVVVKASSPMVVGDKMSGRFGDKGVVAAIVPDDEMPTDAHGKPYECLVNPLGLISRVNPAQIIETALGKVAERTGKPYKLQDFDTKRDMIEFAFQELKKHNMNDLESVVDPDTGRKINDIFTGNRWFMKLHHTSESKAQGRGLGAYTMDGAPAKGGDDGAKRVGMLNLGAILSHGAGKVAREFKMIRGQANPEYWSQFMSGFKPATPEVPDVYRKYMAQLQSAGINPVRDGTRTHLMAMTDKDINEYAGDRVIENTETVSWDGTMKPKKGGLFDETLTGGHDGCFHPSVQVWTEHGMIPIGKIVRERLQVNVWSYDFETSSFVLRPVTGWFRNHSAEGIGRSVFMDQPGRLGTTIKRFRPTTLWGTRAHQVYDNAGQKHDLSTMTELQVAVEQLSYSQDQLLYGTMLGDAYLQNGSYHATHGDKQKRYLELKQQILRPLADKPARRWLDRSGGLSRYKVAFYTTAHAAFRDAESLCYVRGRKTVTVEWLSKVDEMGLAFWYMDDGSLSTSTAKRTVRVTLSTHSFSKQEIDLLRDWLRTRWQLESYTSRDGKYADRDCGWVIELSGEFAVKFLRLVSPYVPAAMQYKLPPLPKLGSCRDCGSVVHRRREICNRCLLAEARSCGSHKIPKHIRRLFGGTTAVRELLRQDVVPAEDLDLADRQQILHLAGSAVDAMVADTAITFRLESVPAEYKWQTGANWERTQTVYDIEVAGEHNYFANGVLVSNSRWAKIALHEPMPNPVMEEPIRRVLGVTEKKFRDILAGREELKGFSGPQAIVRALQNIDINKEIEQSRQQVASARGGKRDDAVRRLGFLKSAQRMGLHPQDWMVNSIPVIPPKFRPVATMGVKKLPLVADANYLLKEAFDANRMLKEMAGQVDDVGDERLALYDSFKAVTGLGDPIHPKNVERGVKGALKQIFGCYDDVTEILTANGWQLFSELQQGIPVGTLNPKTGAFEWQVPSEYQQYPYDGEMACLQLGERKHVDLLVTPNHRNWVRNRSKLIKDHDLSKGWQIEEAYKTVAGSGRKWFQTAAFDWIGHEGRPSFLPPQCSLENFAAIVGWWVAEGWIHSDGTSADICQETKRNATKCQQIAAAIQASGFKFSDHTYTNRGANKTTTARQWSIKDKQLVAWLREHCGTGANDKKLSRFIKDWSRPALTSMFLAYQGGDGGACQSKRGKKTTHRHRSPLTDDFNRLHTTSKRLYDDMMEVCCKLGLTLRPNTGREPTDVRARLYRGGVCGQAVTAQEGSNGKSFVPYTGNVYCVTVPNGIVFVRRNGIPVFSGNSSPKYGTVQRKLLSTTTDLVGRATVVPDPELDMDSVGLPEEKAWDIYSPFIIRNLVRRGMSRFDAADAVEQKQRVARDAMMDEMKSRPVMVDRAPVLHRYGVMAFWPRVTKDNTMHLSPLVVGGFNADFDGDAMQFHVPGDDDSAQEMAEKMLPSKNLLSASRFKAHYLPSQEYVGGLYAASARVDKQRKERVFRTLADAISAMNAGEINFDTRVAIHEH